MHIDHVRNANSHLFPKILSFIIPSGLFGLSKRGGARAGRDAASVGGGDAASGGRRATGRGRPPHPGPARCGASKPETAETGLCSPVLRPARPYLRRLQGVLVGDLE